jgi:hypothetical protein
VNLRKFVALTVAQIVQGVNDAQAEVKDLGAEVNPNLSGSVPKEFVFAAGQWATVVFFDIGVTVTEGAGAKGGIGVFTGAFNLGSAGQAQTENTAVNRVRFALPLTLPRKRKSSQGR